jgi:TldD protein
MTFSADPARCFTVPASLNPMKPALWWAALWPCDDGELYLQFIASEAFGFDDGRLKTCDYSREAGFGLRGVSGEMTGFAHANEISAAAIARAGETLTLLDPRRAPRPRRRCAPTAIFTPMPRRSTAWNLPPRSRCSNRSMPPPAPATRAWRRFRPRFRFVVGGGNRARRCRCRHRHSPAGAAECLHRGRTERAARNGSFGIGGRYLYDDLMKPETWNRAIDAALAQALVNLESVAAPAGEMTVLLAPGWPGCCCMKRWAMALKAISTARAPALSRAVWASAWPRRA